ncbi:hypothetical protein TYRP_004188 [Tyrophagus putrescentiae]|nr:hypothetical protein TYRP_004188 [Tyrophagus putrescentiae]
MAKFGAVEECAFVPPKLGHHHFDPPPPPNRAPSLPQSSYSVRRHSIGNRESGPIACASTAAVFAASTSSIQSLLHVKTKSKR